MPVDVYPYCPFCKQVVEGESAMKFDESREVECKNCKMKFQAAKDILVPQRTSYLVRPRSA